ncbi:MAG: DUF1292 domain-containing protein [Christensenellales bacterium]|jgi:uncharacterized protein YrzB (UPF0473 family)
MAKNYKKDIEIIEDEIITLVDEDGAEIDFYEVATLDFQGNWYILLEPVEPFENQEEGDLIPFMLGEDAEGNDTFTPVENQRIAEAVFEEFKKMLEEEAPIEI